MLDQTLFRLGRKTDCYSFLWFLLLKFPEENFCLRSYLSDQKGGKSTIVYFLILFFAQCDSLQHLTWAQAFKPSPFTWKALCNFILYGSTRFLPTNRRIVHSLCIEQVGTLIIMWTIIGRILTYSATYIFALRTFSL